jgi:hypothetical protein
MKIKTTEQIILEESYLTEKWVSVDELIEDLDKYIIPKKDITNQDQALENRARKRFIKELIKELKGKQ